VPRRLAALPTPDLHVPGVEVRILLQCWLVEENVSYFMESEAKPNLTPMLKLPSNGWTIILLDLYWSAI
jgi:hypothetical protein